MAKTLEGPGAKSPLNLDEGPPPAKKPKRSLYQQAGSSLQSESAGGLGAEAGTPSIQAQKFLQGVINNLQGLSALLPGVTPITADLTGRLQLVVPQLLTDMGNGGMGLVPMGGGMSPQDPQMAGMGGMGGPQGMPMGAQPPMGGQPMGGPPPMAGPAMPPDPNMLPPQPPI